MKAAALSAALMLPRFRTEHGQRVSVGLLRGTTCLRDVGQ